MAMAGLYRRLLPSPPAIDFASSQGKQLFMEAIHSGTMENFYRLISYFQTQSEPAYCGLASLSMVLNALAIDPGRKWKGPWRWFDESMLDCCEPLEKVKAQGISFGKLACLAQCAGAKVQAFRTNHCSISDFRKYVMECSTSDECHLISSYNRAALKQTGTGHFSPIGGYHAGKDMALILDVARFKYPPHWVPLTILWDAMDNVDETTGQRRGFMLVSRPHREPGLLYTLSCKHESWIGIAKYLMDDVPLLLKSESVKDIQKVISIIFTSLPSNFEEFIKWVAEVRRREDGSQGVSPEEKARLSVKEEVLRQVQGTGLYKHVTAFLSSTNSCRRNSVISDSGENLPDIAASVCCQGAEILSGKSGSQGYCCQETCVKCLQANGSKPITVVCGTVVNGNSEQGVDMLVPSSQSSSMCHCSGSKDHIWFQHPAGNDVLTALLLALPPETWSGIKEENLLQEIYSLVSTENLPNLLQEEALHLRRQLHLLKRCQENKVDEVLSAPLF
ncbi:glutathione gamma-glutamylcysteinyltransferase 1-like isoform X2 [Humulus lupulus]|uniref:glutathione gamma-glutamylcysteinyltransferase 1-like isoform X2 n=1 Tax=Humulus lupulus TaxID=3486 RepID=UPI002B414618|nr:glutathione gamma-glutamylcysteinyltransferase 1-like isoform X2 [Humulus lupulus]